MLLGCEWVGHFSDTLYSAHEQQSTFSVARLGGFPPNWATFDFILRGKNALGGYIKFGLILPTSGGFLIL